MHGRYSMCCVAALAYRIDFCEPHDMNDADTSGLPGLYEAHLRVLRSRFDQALATIGYESALIHSGSLPALFRDDQTGPFKALAWFKSWAPLTDVPDCFIHYDPRGTPVLAFHKPIDYWYKPAELPQSFWTRHFDLRPVPDREAARTALP